MSQQYWNEEDDREFLLDLGLDPDEPDSDDLAPHGMSEEDGYEEDPRSQVLRERTFDVVDERSEQAEDCADD